MPEMAGIAQADGLAILDDVRDDQHFRLRGQLELAQHVDLQGTEAAAEIDLLLRRDALLAEHQHVMVEVGVVQALEVAQRQRLRQVQPQHLRAERRIERLDTEMPGGMRGFQDGRHGNSPRVRGSPLYAGPATLQTKHLLYGYARRVAPCCNSACHAMTQLQCAKARHGPGIALARTLLIYQF
jgi:hypothetical protein